MIYNYEDFKQELMYQHKTDKTLTEFMDVIWSNEMERFIFEIADSATLMGTSELLTWYSKDPSRLEIAEMQKGTIEEKLRAGITDILIEIYNQYLLVLKDELADEFEELKETQNS